MNPVRDKINTAYKTIHCFPPSINFVMQIKTIELKYVPEQLYLRQGDAIRKQRNLVAKNNEKSLF